MNGPLPGLSAALGFLTILPVGSRDAGGLASARGWFPAVGLLLGLTLACLDLLMQWGYPLLRQAQDAGGEYRQFPPALSASILVVALAFLTRALHLDGFMDCCDALLGGFDRERRLAILRDSHVGAFAVVGAAGLLLLKVAAIMALPLGANGEAVRFWILLLFPCLSRWGMLLVLEFFPYARSQGIGVPFQPSGGSSRRHFLNPVRMARGQLLGGLAVAVAATIALAGPGGLALLAFATVVAVGLALWASRLLGGVTGDVYGAVNETVEAAVLILAAVLAYALSDGFLRPIYEWSW